MAAPAILMGLVAWTTVCLAQAPEPPEGLEGGGGGAETPQRGPTLPSGLDEEPISEEQERSAPARRKWRLPEGLSGFWEVRAGLRIHEDPDQDDFSLAETRLQLSYDRYLAGLLPRGRIRVTGDLIYDANLGDHEVDLEQGEGFLDLRELWVSLTPLDFLDLKAGRQILTWGTGNLLFLNDLFPKDYQSFFLGRDLDYLKAPSDALRVSLYGDFLNLEVVYTPKFDADRFVDGTRISFFDPALGELRGQEMPLETDRPDGWFQDDEVALRLHRNFGAFELAAYGYYGFWKSPSGRDPQTGRGIFPELSAYGASIRGPLGAGIGNAELSWYDSREDADGDDPLVENGQLRLLVGYEQEIATNLTLGLQYYLEHMLDHGAYQENLPEGFPARERDRHWITLDLNREFMAQEQLRAGLFVFYSASTGDAYFRPVVTYEVTDHWRLQLGGNVFVGDRDTFFGQFEKGSSVYGAVRYSF